MRIPLFFLPLASFLACGPPQVTMEAVATDIGVHVTELTEELDSHATKSAAATTVSGIAELDTAHRTATLALLAKLDEMVGHMGMCMDEKKVAPDLASCKDAMAKVRAAAEGHTALVAGKAGLTEARAEEDRHHTDLGPQLTIMKTQAASMSSMAKMFMCPADSMGAGH